MKDKKTSVEDFNREGDQASRLAADRGNRYGDYMARGHGDHPKGKKTHLSRKALKIARDTSLS